MADKLVLVPDEQFRRIQQQSDKSILANVKRPHDQELVKTYTNIERVMNDPMRTDQEKVAEHVEAMNKFTSLKNRVEQGAARITPPQHDSASEFAVNVMPPTIQRPARQLLNMLRGRRDLISWAPNGEVTIDGKPLLGSNISDFIGDVLRLKKDAVPERDKFLQVLAKANVPDEFVRNKKALVHYRKIKRGGNRPPGLPDLEESEWEEEYPEMLVKPKAKPKPKRVPKVKRLAKPKIQWKNL